MEPPTHRHPRKCVAHRSDKELCERWAIEGGTVCPTHGGSVKRVKEAAQRRLLELVSPALARLSQALDMEPQSKDEWAVIMRAIKEVLDRAGIDTARQIEILPNLESVEAALALIEAEEAETAAIESAHDHLD